MKRRVLGGGLLILAGLLAGGRAFVVQAQAPVAEVDLDDFRVHSRPPAPVARVADAVAGPSREALWLGAGMLAVTGSDQPSPGENGGRDVPAGLSLTTPVPGTLARSTRAPPVLVSGTVLSSTFLEQTRSGSGLTGYSRQGRRLFHRFGDDPIWGVQPLGRHAFVGGPNGSALIDARTGQQLRRYRRFSMALLSDDALVTP